jgi:aldose 1-epimerase
MTVERTDLGMTDDGRLASLYTVTNDYARLTLTDLGATIVSLEVPDRDGALRDVVWGYDGIEGYRSNRPSFGSTVGRNTNRIGGARFTLGDTVYELERNNGDNNIHSGSDRYKYRIWRADFDPEGCGVSFRLMSPHMDQGFPGNAIVTVTISLFDTVLSIAYHAVADMDTVFNMTNHSYFNLDGQQGTDILSHTLRVNADAFTPCDQGLLPTGEVRPVDGTPFDFRIARSLGQDMMSDDEQISYAGGYDHNLVLGDPGEYGEVAELRSDASGIGMFIATTLPGMQVYTANSLDENDTKGGVHRGRHSAICLETQHFPDAVNRKEFPSPVVKVGEPYDAITEYTFFNF